MTAFLIHENLGSYYGDHWLCGVTEWNCITAAVYWSIYLC